MKISIFGKAVTITYSNVNKKSIEQFMGNDDADVFSDLHDQSKKSFVIQGVFDENAQVMIDNQSWNDREGVIELMKDFHLIGEPRKQMFNMN